MAIGSKRIERRCLELATYCRDRLGQVGGIKIISSDDPELSSAIVSFSLEGHIKNGDVFRQMRDKNITIKRLPQYNAIRISNHMFTTHDDVDRMVTLLQKLIA